MEIRLTELLEERHMTKTDLAKKMGVTIDALPRNNRFKPSLAAIQKIADALEVPVWEMLVDCGASSVGLEDNKPIENLQSCPHCGAVIKTSMKISVVTPK